MKKVSTSEQKSEGSESSTVASVGRVRLDLEQRVLRYNSQIVDLLHFDCSAVVSVLPTDWVRTSSA